MLILRRAIVNAIYEDIDLPDRNDGALQLRESDESEVYKQSILLPQKVHVKYRHYLHKRSICCAI